jgi:uncharacterized protein (DUF1330 family)
MQSSLSHPVVEQTTTINMSKSAFFLAFLKIPDPTAAALAEYYKCVNGSLAPFNGVVVCRANATNAPAAYAERTTMSDDFDVAVLIKFGSEEDASAWYKSEEYQRILPMRTGCSNGPGAIVVNPYDSVEGAVEGKKEGKQNILFFSSNAHAAR